MKNWRKLAAIVLAGIMVFALAACTTAPEKEAETEPTKEVTPPTGEGTSVNESLVTIVDPETYKEFIGTWYADGSSASYRLNVKDTGTWELVDAAGDIASSGSLRYNSEDEMLEMYDPDGSIAITAAIEEDGVIHCEIMMESLADTLSTNYFYNKITNDISDAPPVDVQDDSHLSDDGEVTPPPVEEEPIG